MSWSTSQELPEFLGFDLALSIAFQHHMDLQLDDRTKEKPVANTYAKVVQLPVSQTPTYKQFKKRFVEAVMMR